MLNAQLRIQDTEGVEIPQHMIGVFFEDINYGLDGGLSAEMIENRNFEFLDCYGDFDDYHQTFDGMYGWSAYPAANEQVSLMIEDKLPVSKVNIHYITIQTKQNNYGVSNKAYDGICLKKGQQYRVSFYAMANAYQGKVTVQIVKNGKIAAQTYIDHIGTEWNQHQTVLTAEEDVKNAEFVLTLTEPGTVHFDMVSLIPEDAVLGVFRADLVKLLKDMKPGFMRFPGGCVVEGNELTNRYQWKESVGPVLDRKANWNRWAVHCNNKENQYHSMYAHYNQTLAIGFYEYFLLCEYMKAKAIPVVNVGLACQYQSTQLVSMEDKEFQTYIQDALDLIEFANGDINSTYGSLRASMGHPEPFNLEYIGIGNEQWNTEHVDYYRRYEAFEAAIHASYPEMKLISSAGPDVLTPRYEDAWKWLRTNQAKNAAFTEAVDEHYYVSPQWCLDHVDFYDNYPRNVKVFAGEYAAHIDNGMNHPEYNTLGAALAEAALLTGLIKNADVVALACYAPLFARVGYTQWSPDMIWFDEATAYGTPSYYVQKLNSLNLGNQTYHSEVIDGNKQIFSVVTYDSKTKEIIIKVVNVGSEEASLSIALPVGMQIDANGSVDILSSAKQDDSNSIDQPCLVAPVKEKVVLGKENTVLLKGYSFNVYRFGVQ